MTPVGTSWSRGNARLFAAAGWLGSVLGWLAIPLGVFAAGIAVTIFAGSFAFVLSPVYALGAALCVRIGTCGRWARERDVSSWPDMRTTARLAVAGPAVLEVLALGLGAIRQTRELSWFLVETTAWFAVPMIVAGELFILCARVMEQRQRGNGTR